MGMWLVTVWWPPPLTGYKTYSAGRLVSAVTKRTTSSDKALSNTFIAQARIAVRVCVILVIYWTGTEFKATVLRPNPIPTYIHIDKKHNPLHVCLVLTNINFQQQTVAEWVDVAQYISELYYF